MDSPPPRYCPLCGTQALKEQEFCSNCGFYMWTTRPELEDQLSSDQAANGSSFAGGDDPAVLAVVQEAGIGERKCSNCGVSVPVQANYCPSCKQSLAMSSDIPFSNIGDFGRHNSYKRSGVRALEVTAVLGCLVLCVGCMLAARSLMLNFSSSAETSNTTLSFTTDSPEKSGRPVGFESTLTVNEILSSQETPSLFPTLTVTQIFLSTRTIAATVAMTSSRTPRPTPSLTPTLAELWEACPGVYLSRLRVGDRAVVSFDPPLANNVREGAGKQYPVIGKIRPGEELTILDGPMCAAGWIWWYVEADTGLAGWTSEGDGDKYWLDKLPD